MAYTVTCHQGYAVVTPLRKAASYEPRIAILGIWGDMWLTRGNYGIYVAVRGSYGALSGSMWRLLEILPRKISTFYCRVSYVMVTRIVSCNHGRKSTQEFYSTGGDTPVRNNRVSPPCE